MRRLKGRGWQNTGNQRKQTHPKGERVHREKVQGKNRDKQELVKLLDYERKISDLAGGCRKKTQKLHSEGIIKRRTRSMCKDNVSGIRLQVN